MTKKEACVLKTQAFLRIYKKAIGKRQEEEEGRRRRRKKRKRLNHEEHKEGTKNTMAILTYSERMEGE